MLKYTSRDHTTPTLGIQCQDSLNGNVDTFALVGLKHHLREMAECDSCVMSRHSESTWHW